MGTNQPRVSRTRPDLLLTRQLRERSLELLFFVLSVLSIASKTNPQPFHLPSPVRHLSLPHQAPFDEAEADEGAAENAAEV